MLNLERQRKILRICKTKEMIWKRKKKSTKKDQNMKKVKSLRKKF